MRRTATAIALLAAVGCGAASGKQWVNELPEDGPPPGMDDWRREPSPPKEAVPSVSARSIGEDEEPPFPVRDLGDGVPLAVLPAQASEELFRNTYYDFPRE